MTTTEADVTMGEKAPDLKLQTPEGAEIQLSMLWNEKPLAIVFLGALENALSAENAILWRDADETMREAGGEIIAICGSTPDDANEFRGRWNLPYPLLCDGGTAYELFDVSGGQPGCFVLDQEGTVRYLHRNESELDNPPTWDLIDTVSGITGKTVEKPQPTPIGEEGEDTSAWDEEAYAVPLAGAPGALNYTCSKCANKDYEVLDMSSTSGMLSRMVNLQNRRFAVVVCRRCKYCELYKAESGALRNAFDFLVGA